MYAEPMIPLSVRFLLFVTASTKDCVAAGTNAAGVMSKYLHRATVVCIATLEISLTEIIRSPILNSTISYLVILQRCCAVCVQRQEVCCLGSAVALRLRVPIGLVVARLQLLQRPVVVRSIGSVPGGRRDLNQPMD